MAPTNYTVTSPNGGTWTIQSTDTAQVGRYHDLALLTEGSLTNMSRARAGVLAGPADAGQSVPTALLTETAGSGLSATVRPGAAVVERGTLVGSYLVQSWATGTVTLATADATNSRVDRIDLQVLDGALGDNGGTSLTQVVVTSGTGTPSGGVIPIAAAPVNSIPLATVLLPANTTTLTAGMITRTRKSAGLRGSARFLLEGDALSDPGFVLGEQRMRYNSTYGLMIDYWSAIDSAWHGTAPEELSTFPSGNVSCALNAMTVVATIAIVDPGWAYYVKVSGQAYYSAGGANTTSAWITLDSTTGASGVIIGMQGTDSAPLDQSLPLAAYRHPTVLTGAHTIRLVVQSGTAGTTFASTGAIGRATWLDCSLVPV